MVSVQLSVPVQTRRMERSIRHQTSFHKSVLSLLQEVLGLDAESVWGVFPHFSKVKCHLKNPKRLHFSAEGEFQSSKDEEVLWFEQTCKSQPLSFCFLTHSWSPEVTSRDSPHSWCEHYCIFDTKQTNPKTILVYKVAHEHVCSLKSLKLIYVRD